MDLAVELAEFERNFAQFLVLSEREVGEALAQQARLYVLNPRAGVGDVMHRTPPFDRFSGLEAFGVQRRVGIEAVKGQIESLFAPIEALTVSFTKSEKLRTQFQAAVDGGDLEQIEFLAVNVGKYPRSMLVPAPTKALHNRWRDRRGRVRVRRPKFYVTGGKRAIAGYVKQKQKNVGIAKAGFVAAARQLGARSGIPQWIAGQKNLGAVADERERGIDPFITIRNTVPYIGALESQVHMSVQALRDRHQALKRQCEANLSGLWGRRSRRRAA